MKIKEEIANSAGSGNIAALGVGPKGEPGFTRPQRILRRGKFMQQETLVIPSELYNSLREAKRKHKHWRKYLSEDDAYHEIREIAKKKRKGPIIVEDERTGACMYIRYGDMK